MVPASPKIDVHVYPERDTLLPVESNDRILILRAQKGDKEAFSTLVEEHWVRLVRFARSLVGDADAEDSAQEAFILAWRKLPGLRNPDAFPTWLFRIASRTCLHRARTRLRVLPLCSVTEPADAQAALGAEAIDVERVLDALPPRQRAVMHLTVIQGMSDSEIGNILDIAAASVRSHRRRARETLHQRLSEERKKKGLLT